MIILGDRKLIAANFRNEREVEDLVIANAEHFFGSSSIFIRKALIATKDGYGTIPDGFAVDIASRTWYVVEAELGHHSVWTHIAPQVSKQLLAAARPETHQILIEILVRMVTEDLNVREIFYEEGIKEIDIRKILADIFSKPPIIGMPIDFVSNDLREWAETLRNDVRLWLVRKYVQFGAPNVVAYDIPEEFRPVLDTTSRDSPRSSGINSYDVNIVDLMDAGLLTLGEKLSMIYRPKGGIQQLYEATIGADGSLVISEQSFPSPSYAALYCIQQAGSSRTTVNGWMAWRDGRKQTLAQVRAEYLRLKDLEANAKAADTELI